MKPEIEREESNGIEEQPPETVIDARTPMKLLEWRETIVVVREPEPPRFVERTSDFGHWGINE